MANEILYGLKFNTKDMERLIKLAEQLDKQEKLVVKDYQTGEKKKTEAFDSELKKREKYLKQDKAWQKQLRNIDLANEKKYQAEVTRNQREEQRKREQIAKQTQNGKFDMFAPAKVAKRVGGYIATSTVVYQGLAAMRRGIDAGIDYEQTMANTYSALGQVTEAEKARMTQMALGTNIVDTYAMSAKDVAQSFEVLAKAGLDAKESMQSFQPAMQLAKLSNQDLGTSTQILAESLTELDKPMSYSQELVDKLAYAADKSTVNIGDIAESFKIAAPVAKQYGMSINELTANIAMFGKAGIKGREAGNALARIMLRLKKDSANPDVIAAIKNNRTFTDVLVDLQKRGYTGLTEVQKEFGLYAGKNVSQFMSVAKEAKGLTEQLDGGASVGSAMNKLNTIMDTTNNQIQRMKSAWDNLFISQDGMNTIIGDTAGGLATLLNALKEFPDATKAIVACTAALSAMGILLASNPFTGAAMLIAGIGVAALGVAENIRKMNAEVAKSAGLTAGTDFSSYGASIKTADDVRAKYASMSENELLQEKLKLLGQIRLETYEDRKTVAKWRGKVNDNNDVLRESLKRWQNAESARFYLKMMQSTQRQSAMVDSVTPSSSVIPTGGKGGKAPKTPKEDWSEYEDFIRNMNQSFDDRKEAYDEIAEYERNKRDNMIAYQKEIDDYREQSLKRQEEVRQKYQGVDGKLADMQLEMNYEIEMAKNNEELILNIKKDYAEQAMQLYREDWEKKNKVANAALGSMEAGYSSFAQAMSDDLQISKNESEAIWEAMKQSFITKIMEMAWAAALSGIFSFFMNPAQSFLGGFKGGVGGGAMGGTAGFGAGSIFNSPMSGGGGVSLPSMAMVQGTGGGANNNALINELRALRMATASGMAQTVKAINENTPVIQGKFLDAVDVFKASKVGERKANLVVSAK